MKTYRTILQETKQVDKLICNCCGKEIPARADHLSIEKTWGYDSNKDGVHMTLDICEACFDAWTETMALPPVAE